MSACGDAREDAIRSLFPLVKIIARRVHRIVRSGEVDDLIGDGCVGAIRAVDTFDPARGPSLERYASRIIAGAMLNGLRRLDPVSERVRREIRESERERYALAGERGALPSQREMEMRRPALRRATVHAYRHAPLSLDGPLPPDERLAGDWDADPASCSARRCEREGLLAALESLPARQQHIMRLHYFNGRSLHQIGKAMQISPQRTSQLHLSALKKMRKAMHVAH